jgi:release factor glutamine methyltransferase
MEGERPHTVEDLVRQGRALGVDRLDTRLLIAQGLGQSPTWVLTHGDVAVAATNHGHILHALTQRAAGEPLAYLVGGREFHGLWLEVDRRVLVPRPDTETLVDWALDLLMTGPLPPPAGGRWRLLDLGTGSGAIALALAHALARATRLDAAEVWATDASADALAVAAANQARLRLSVRWLHGDWWEAVTAAVDPSTADGPWFDLVVSNPPYIAPGDPHLAELGAEPTMALVAAEDGLADIRHILHGAHRHVRPSGWLLFEHGHDQGDAVRAEFERRGFGRVEQRQDLGGHIRCTGGQRSPTFQLPP